MKRFICFSLIMAGSLLWADDLVWEWQNPKPQGNTLYDVAVLDENTMIAVGEHGTIVRTEDGGETWDVQHHIGSTAKRDARLNAVHFVNSTTGWIASNTGMLKTTDGGETWSVQDASAFSTCHFACADTGWACTGGMIKKTTDGGQNWHATIIDTNEIIGLFFQDIYFTNSTLGWAIGSVNYGGARIFRTIDGGINWKCMSGYADYDISRLSSIYFLDSGWGWAASNYDGKVIHSKTNGATWQLQDTGINKDIYSIQFINKTTGYAVCEGGIIITTNDSGETWRTIESPVNQSLRSIRFYNDTIGWAVGINGAMIKTTDGGQTWQNMQEISITTSLNDIFFIDENVGWAVGKGGSIYKTVNGGTWYNCRMGQDENLKSIQFWGNTGVCVGSQTEDGFLPDSGTVLKSIDAGENWIDITPDSGEVLRSVWMIDSLTYISVGVYGTIFKTIDGGETYIKYNSQNQYLNDLFFIDSHGWIVGSYKKLLKTTDYGDDWQEIDIEFSGKSIFFVDQLTGWMISSDNLIYKTVNGGVDWILYEYDNITNEYLNSIQFIDENDGWLLGKKLYKTENDGEEWIVQKSPFGGGTSMHFLDVNQGWYCSSNKIIKVDEDMTNVINDRAQKKSPQNIQLFQNYPNPFNPKTMILYCLPNKSKVALSIYNLNGQLVETLVDKNQIQGQYQVIWDASGLPSGVYFYQLRTDKSVETRKLVLLR